MTTKSGGGAYYGICESLEAAGVTGMVFSLAVVDWGGAYCSFVPYLDGSNIAIFGDYSQTVTVLSIRVAYWGF